LLDVGFLKSWSKNWLLHPFTLWLKCIVWWLQAGTGIAELIALETSKQVGSYF